MGLDLDDRVLAEELDVQAKIVKLCEEITHFGIYLFQLRERFGRLYPMNPQLSAPAIEKITSILDELAKKLETCNPETEQTIVEVTELFNLKKAEIDDLMSTFAEQLYVHCLVDRYKRSEEIHHD